MVSHFTSRLSGRLVDDASVEEVQNAIGAGREAFVVRDEQHAGLFLAGEADQQVGDRLGVRAVETARRFVRQQHGGLHQESPRQGRPLSFPARQDVRSGLRARAKSDPLEEAHGTLALVEPDDQAGQGGVVEHGEVLEEVVVLKDESESPGPQQRARLAVEDVGAVVAPVDFAPRRSVETAEQMQQGALAAAAGSGHRHDLAGPHGDADAVQDMHGAELVMKVVGAEGERHTRMVAPGADALRSDAVDGLAWTAMSRRDHLLRSPLFQNVPEDAVRIAEEAVTERFFRPGDTLVSQDAQGEALFLITHGRARVVRVSLGGRERVLGFLYAPAVFGEIAVLSTQSRMATVVADTEVHALMLYRSEFEQLLNRYPKVLWNLARILADRISAQNDELIAVGISTEASMAHVFVNLHKQRLVAGELEPARLPLTQFDLMLRLSSSRETVSRVLKKMEREGLVAVEAGSVVLRDVERLDELVYGLED